MRSEDLSEREYDAQRAIQHKRLGKRGLPEDRHGRDADALAAGAGEAPAGEDSPIPAEEVTDPNPTRIGER